MIADGTGTGNSEAVGAGGLRQEYPHLSRLATDGHVRRNRAQDSRRTAWSAAAWNAGAVLDEAVQH